MSALPADSALPAAHFHEISGIVHDVSGIALLPGREGHVCARLARRLRARGVGSYGDYLALVRDPADRELSEMVDALTTNTTRFFREPAHFDLLRAHVLPGIPGGEPLRVWSAGCASGEEPYSLAMTLHDARPDLVRSGARILATDLSRRMLAHASAGVYSNAATRDVPEMLRRRHFTARAGATADDETTWEVAPHLRSLVTVAPLNLVGRWPMRGPFQAIFCRNVMIYFDRATQQTLVQRFAELLAPGGYLFVGHAESLHAVRHDLTYVQPAVYRR